MQLHLHNVALYAPFGKCYEQQKEGAKSPTSRCGKEFHQRLACNGPSWFRLVGATGLSRVAARNQLLRLGSFVVRASPAQAFFLIVTPEHASRGCPPVTAWIDDYFNWLGHPYYLALQTAASAHGASPQAIQVAQVITDTPRRALQIGRLRMTFFVKRSVRETPTQQMPNALALTQMSTPGATAFDLVRYAARIGGVGRTVETLRPLLPKIRGNELRATLDAADEATTAQRLGFLLVRLGAEDLSTVVDKWLKGRRALIPLATSAPAGKKCLIDRRWQIIDNTWEFRE